MTKNNRFLIVSLIAMMAVSPAFSETTATREWVKAQVYDKYIQPQGVALNTINSRLATDVRDKIYTYDTNKDSPTYRQILNPLNTGSTNAFDGINEVLLKVNGNDGTANSEVQLETTAQNAFGAINELNDKIDDKQDSLTPGYGVVINNNVISVDETVLDMPDQVGKIYDTATQTYKSVAVVDEFDDKVLTKTN